MQPGDRCHSWQRTDNFAPYTPERSPPEMNSPGPYEPLTVWVLGFRDQGYTKLNQLLSRLRMGYGFRV